MTAILRSTKHALLALALAAAGCSETPTENAAPSGPEPAVSANPAVTPPPPGNASPAPEAAKDELSGEASRPAGLGKEDLALDRREPAPAPKEASSESPKPLAVADDNGAVKLELVKFDQFLARMTNKNVKYTVVDVWATWCGPCKENFPHLVEMNKKYGGKDLAFASLSFDDPAEAKQVHDAQEFLTAKKAEFANYLLDEEQGVGNEKLDINAIPAVFIFGSDGKIVKKFSMDDPNHQFTYDDVEKTVLALRDGKPLPKDEPAKPEAK